MFAGYLFPVLIADMLAYALNPYFVIQPEMYQVEKHKMVFFCPVQLKMTYKQSRTHAMQDI